ncbi:ATP-dependent 6-phosphofructokinase, partial [Myxococcota bacterium]|nr:ATP-dependent 6-phosphofructokinase [Myxococcota bacterium]
MLKHVGDLSMEVTVLGPCKNPSPLALSVEDDDFIPNYAEDEAKVLYTSLHDRDVPDVTEAFEAAGPRREIYFDPRKIRAGIVTCGGLCPGINNVVSAIVNELINEYKVRSVVGFRYGFAGLVASEGLETWDLTPESTRNWNLKGGSMLGSSRGPQDPEEMLDTLEQLNINVLFTIGGDGTLRGARAMFDAAQARGSRIAMVGVPKTIDNDIPFINRTFGFETAVSKAAEAIVAAQIEAEGAQRGVGLVRLMGRHSGYIAAHAALAAGNTDVVLVPESPFQLEGPNGLYEVLERRLQKQGHAVIVVAEGAGQDLFDENDLEKDASGNRKLMDIGRFLGDRLIGRNKSLGRPVNLKYIDPSYIIRAMPASPMDAIFCRRLGENAVHAAMAGRTGLVVG